MATSHSEETPILIDGSPFVFDPALGSSAENLSLEILSGIALALYSIEPEQKSISLWGRVGNIEAVTRLD